MLDNGRSRWFGIDSWAGQPLASLTAPVEEGMALCAVMENGRQAAIVQNTVTANDVFIGVAYGWYTTPLSSVAVETYTVPTNGGAITINNAPSNGANGAGLRVYNVTSGSVVTYNATSGTGNYQVGGTNNQTLTFNAAQAGNIIQVTYAYAPSVLQAQAKVGNGWLGDQPSSVTGTIGLIRRGMLFTSNFDPAADYSAVNTQLRVQNGGLFGVGGNGPLVNGLVVEMPSMDFPYLGINFSAV